MTTTRRTFLGGMLVAGAGTALGACGDGASGQAEGGALRFSIWFGEGDIEVWKKVIANFEKKNPGITVKFEPLEYASFWTKLNTQLAGGNAPDVVGMQFQQAALGPQGQLEPLGDQFADELGKMPDTLAKVGQADMDGETEQYALPWRFVGSSLYANLTALEDAGIQPPTKAWTLDDFLAASKELTGGESFGVLAPGGSMLTPIASTFGAMPVSPDGTRAKRTTLPR